MHRFEINCYELEFVSKRSIKKS